MSYTRREWINGVTCAMPSYFVPQRGPASQDPPICSGHVRGPNGPLANWTVQLIQQDGKVQNAMTDSQGEYKFPQPVTGAPYMLAFRENQGSASVHEVRRLTANIRQTVSVTIDPSGRSFQSVYNGLQALESVATFAQSFAAARDVLKSDVERIPDSLGRLRQGIAAIQVPGQRDFLTNKASNIEQFAKVALA